MPVFPLFSVILLGIITGRVRRAVCERKAREERNVGYCKDQMNILQSFAEPPLKNVSTKPPDPDGGSTDIEKRFVPSTSEMNPKVHKTFQPEDPLAHG